MSLYLTVFDGAEEIDGVEIGHYSDFAAFRETIAQEFERGVAGSLFPILMLHSDCDGEWSPEESSRLVGELSDIAERMTGRPPVDLGPGWKRDVARVYGLHIRSLYDCYFDVDGEPLVDRLISLAETSRRLSLPIIFQ